jgi:hypothetical protein
MSDWWFEFLGGYKNFVWVVLHSQFSKTTSLAYVAKTHTRSFKTLVSNGHTQKSCIQAHGNLAVALLPLFYNYYLKQGCRTYGTSAQKGTRKDFLDTLSLLSQILCVSFAQPASLYCESDCVETVYELSLLPNYTAVKHFYTNRKHSQLLK